MLSNFHPDRRKEISKKNKFELSIITWSTFQLSMWPAHALYSRFDRNTILNWRLHVNGACDAPSQDPSILSSQRPTTYYFIGIIYHMQTHLKKNCNNNNKINNNKKILIIRALTYLQLMELGFITWKKNFLNNNTHPHTHIHTFPVSYCRPIVNTPLRDLTLTSLVLLRWQCYSRKGFCE